MASTGSAASVRLALRVLTAVSTLMSASPRPVPTEPRVWMRSTGTAAAAHQVVLAPGARKWSYSRGPAGPGECPSRMGVPGWKTATAAAAWMATGIVARYGADGSLACSLVSPAIRVPSAPQGSNVRRRPWVSACSHPVRTGGSVQRRSLCHPAPPVSHGAVIWTTTVPDSHCASTVIKCLRAPPWALSALESEPCLPRGRRHTTASSCCFVIEHPRGPVLWRWLCLSALQGTCLTAA